MEEEFGQHLIYEKPLNFFIQNQPEKIFDIKGNLMINHLNIKFNYKIFN